MIKIKKTTKIWLTVWIEMSFNKFKLNNLTFSIMIN